MLVHEHGDLLVKQRQKAAQKDAASWEDLVNLNREHAEARK